MLELILKKIIGIRKNAYHFKEKVERVLENISKRK